MDVLPVPREPTNRYAWCTRSLLDRVAERADDVLLAHHVVRTCGGDDGGTGGRSGHGAVSLVAVGRSAGPPPIVHPASRASRARPAALDVAARAGWAAPRSSRAALRGSWSAPASLNYDTAYCARCGAATWRRGDLPDYDVPVAPTPHPLGDAAGRRS